MIAERTFFLIAMTPKDPRRPNVSARAYTKLDVRRPIRQVRVSLLHRKSRLACRSRSGNFFLGEDKTKRAAARPKRSERIKAAKVGSGMKISWKFRNTYERDFNKRNV